MRSLTEAEARRRAALVTVDRYDIAMDLTDLPTGPAVRCVSTIEFTCRESGAETFVDCAAEVVAATLNDRALEPAAEGRIQLPDLAARNTLRVETVQTDTTSGPGVHKAVDPADGEVYLWTSFEPDEARYVWACFDQPDLKAPHRFTVTAPAGWTVLSNSAGPLVEPVGPARRWTFPDTPPLSTYNTVVDAGPLCEIRREIGGYDLGLYARRSLAAVLDRDAEEIFTVTGQGLEFFGAVFGLPFPQRTYNQVFMPEYGGAMENYGCVTWSDFFLRRAAPTPAERELLARVLLHEMAHMWFGNIVTMRWWDDLWLNEAFAEFAAHWAATRATAYTDAWAGHLAAGKLAAYLADQGPTSHPIRQPIADVAQAASIFDAITYPKGASVLRQLMVYVGEANFTTGMSGYFARHAWSSTTLQDLIDALAGASGRDLDAWRTGWLETAGTDRFTLERDGDRAVLVGRGPAGEPRPHVLAVGAYHRAGDRDQTADQAADQAADHVGDQTADQARDRDQTGDGGGLRRTALVPVEVRQSRTPVDLPEDADLYLVNDDDLTFATTRPRADQRAALIADAGELPTAMGRGVAVATVWDMLTTGEATAAEAVRCLTGVLGRESCGSVIEPYLTLAGRAAELWAPDADRAALMAQVAAACRDLAGDRDHRQAALRGFAASAGDLDDVAWLLDQAGDDVDLRWRALQRQAELGGPTRAAVQQLQERDPDPDARTRALAVRAATPDADDKAAMWQVLADRAVPVNAIFDIGAAFWRPGQDDLLTPYRQRYLDLVPELDRGGMIIGGSYTVALFPQFAVDDVFLDQARAAAESATPAVAKPLTERADIVGRMLRSRAGQRRA